MEYKVEGSKRNRKFAEAIMPSLITQLGLSSSRKTLVVKIEDDGETHLGYTVPLDALDAYIVVVKPQRKLKDIGFTLCHEMVHVRQLAKGILKNKGNGVNIWAGKRYGKKTKYLDMPWEQEAFARTEILLRRAIEE
jgi:hypothetical protein